MVIAVVPSAPIAEPGPAVESRGLRRTSPGPGHPLPAFELSSQVSAAASGVKSHPRVPCVALVSPASCPCLAAYSRESP
jgi:hypothetical protein